MSKTFKCESCKGEFNKSWSDEEMQAEWEQNFPRYSKIDLNPAVVCDDCYKQALAWKSPAQAEAELTAPNQEPTQTEEPK